MRILIAEDEPVQRQLLHGLLTKWGHDVEEVNDGQQAWSVLTSPNRPHMAILDWVMPGIDGLRICRELRKDTSREYIFLLVLTSRDRKQDLVEALEAGADDFLTKPFDAQELKARLKTADRILSLQEQLVSANRTLTFQATHDPLTGLFNRGAIVEKLRNELSRCRREKRPLGVVLADLDHFKNVNDTMGHAAGDAVLRGAAQKMQACVRIYDSVGRYGGEEFLILLPGCNPCMTRERAEQVRLMVAEEAQNTPAGKVSITVSMGVASVAGESTCEEVLRAADAALYEAKRKGRNRVERYNEAKNSDCASDVQPVERKS